MSSRFLIRIRSTRRRLAAVAAVAIGFAVVLPRVSGQETPLKPAAGQDSGKLVPLNKDETVLLDAKGKRLLLKTKVVFRDGVLEMLVCRKQTKEHESVLALDAQAFVVHTGLLALGAEVGAPVQLSPEFKPPTGTAVDIFLQWTDEKGKLHRVPAQDWVRHAIRRFYAEKMAKLPADLTIPKKSELRFDAKNQELTWYGPMTAEQRDQLVALSRDETYRKAIKSIHDRTQPRRMEARWVFAGSGFFVDGETGKRHYQAEGGDLICVANFPSAMIDVDVESTSSGEDNLLFEAWTERIPPLDTPVTVELIPVLKKAAPK